MTKRTIRQQWKDIWHALKRPNRVTFVLSAIAIILTIVNIIIYIIQSKQQNDLSREMFLFQRQAQTTTEAQTQKQIDIQNTQSAFNAQLQNTQTAFNAQLESMARLQAFPLMVLVSPKDPAFVITQIGDTNSSVLLVAGNIEVILANNGGARAGLISVDWLNDTSLPTNLLELTIDQVYLGENLVNLPTSIEGQTPVKIQVHLNAEIRPLKISEEKAVFGNRDYQMQRYILNSLYSPVTEIDFQFSNTDPLTIPVSNIIFDIDGFDPRDPTSFVPPPTSFIDRLLSIIYKNAAIYLIGIVVVLASLFTLKYILDRNNKISGVLIFTDGETTIASFRLYNGTNTRNISGRELNTYPQLGLRRIKLQNLKKRRSGRFSKENGIRAECVSIYGRKFSVYLYPHARIGVPPKHSDGKFVEMMYEPNH